MAKKRLQKQIISDIDDTVLKEFPREIFLEEGHEVSWGIYLVRE